MRLGNGDGHFGMTPDVAVGNSPNSVVTGDFNGDGKLDIATANYLSNNVSVLLGNGSGGFAAATNFPVGDTPQTVAVGDINGDGKLDLVTANNGSNNVSVLLGNGSGGFGAATNYAAGSIPVFVVIGDVNADGKADLAVANSGSSNVSVLLGNGNGSFGGATNFATGTRPTAIAMRDVNGDSKTDLAITNFGSNNVSILLGNGSGSFGGATNFAVGNTPTSIAGGDFNADGKPDFVTANANSNNISLLLNCTTAANTPPSVANAIPNQTGTVGQAFAYTIPANTFADAETPAGLTLSATGLPAGLSLTGSTISGTPSASGVSTVTITATDPGSLAVSTNVTFTINPAGSPPPPPSSPGSLTITSVTCNYTGSVLSSVNFVVGYAGSSFTPALPDLFINGITITGQLGVPYSFGFDANQSYLPIQDQATRSTYFVWNFRDACATGGTPPPSPTAPVAPALPNQVATQGSLFSYGVPAFTGTAPITYAATGLPAGLSFDANTRIISGTPTATTLANVVITATNAAGSSTGTFTITVNAPTPPPSSPGSLTITSVTCTYTGSVLSSVNFVVGYAGGSFTPALPDLFINGVTITGQLGVPYSFGFDANQSYLPIQDQATRSTYFVWNFRQACATQPSPARLAAESTTPWQARLVGNPVKNEIVVEVTDAQAQTVELALTDLSGHVVDTRLVTPTTAVHREIFAVQGQGAGLLLLQATSAERRQTLKVLKN